MQSEQQSVLSDNHPSVTTEEKPTFYLPALLRSKHDDCDYTSVWATDLDWCRSEMRSTQTPVEQQRQSLQSVDFISLFRIHWRVNI